MVPSVDVKWITACSWVRLCQKDVALHLLTDLSLSLGQQPSGLWHEFCHRIRVVVRGISLERKRALGHFVLRQRVVGRGRTRRHIRRRGNVELTVMLPTEIGARLIVNWV